MTTETPVKDPPKSLPPVIVPLPPHPLPVLKAWQQISVPGASRPGYSFQSLKGEFFILPVTKYGRRKLTHLGYTAQRAGDWLKYNGGVGERIVHVALMDALTACRRHYDS